MGCRLIGWLSSADSGNLEMTHLFVADKFMIRRADKLGRMEQERRKSSMKVHQLVINRLISNFQEINCLQISSKCVLILNFQTSSSPTTYLPIFHPLLLHLRHQITIDYDSTDLIYVDNEKHSINHLLMCVYTYAQHPTRSARLQVPPSCSHSRCSV